MLECECCCTTIDDHVCHADGSTFCSQGCARAAGAIEAEMLREEERRAALPNCPVHEQEKKT